MHCDDCGTKISSGLCPNCHEEAFIVESSDGTDEFSERFMRKANEQYKAVRKMDNGTK